MEESANSVGVGPIKAKVLLEELDWKCEVSSPEGLKTNLCAPRLG